MFILPEKESFSFDNVVVIDPNTQLTQIVSFNKLYINYPINVNYILTFKKDKLTLKKDKIKYPAAKVTVYEIVFKLLRDTVTWSFESKEERDKEYEKLLKEF